MELGDRLINRRRVKNDSSTHWSIRLQLVTSDDGDLCVTEELRLILFIFILLFFFFFLQGACITAVWFFLFCFCFCFLKEGMFNSRKPVAIWKLLDTTSEFSNSSFSPY